MRIRSIGKKALLAFSGLLLLAMAAGADRSGNDGRGVAPGKGRGAEGHGHGSDRGLLADGSRILDSGPGWVAVYGGKSYDDEDDAEVVYELEDDLESWSDEWSEKLVSDDDIIGIIIQQMSTGSCSCTHSYSAWGTASTPSPTASVSITSPSAPVHIKIGTPQSFTAAGTFNHGITVPSNWTYYQTTASSSYYTWNFSGAGNEATASRVFSSSGLNQTVSVTYTASVTHQYIAHRTCSQCGDVDTDTRNVTSSRTSSSATSPGSATRVIWPFSTTTLTALSIRLSKSAVLSISPLVSAVG